MSGDMMETPVQTLKRAWELDQRGRKLQAEILYQQVLRVEPENAVALFLLGRVELESGRQRPAADHLAAAVQRDASQAVYHATLARAYAALDRHREAVGCYRAALELEPDAADYYTNLARSLLFCKEADQAILCYQKAIASDPNVAEAHSGLGAVLEHLGRVEEALEHYRQAINLRPAYAQAHYNLGTALVRRGQAADAVQSLHAAAQLQPNWDAALANLAAAYHMLGRSDEAREQLDNAIQKAPGEPDHHASLGSLLRHQGRQTEAIESYDRALELQGDHAGAALGKAQALLSLGRFAEAWPGFERRLDVHPRTALSLTEPFWDGAPLAGRTLLVHAERGLRDTIQFIRLVKQIDLDGGKLLLAVPQSLKSLLAESGFENLVARDETLPKFDVHLPLLSLPGLLRLELRTIPADVPYLAVAAERSEKWRAILKPFQGLKVGIAWRGGAGELEQLRSAGLDAFSALGEIPGVDLISLEQVPLNPDNEEERLPRLGDLPQLASSADPLADTAAAIKNLDLVIALDSPVAHLAGALAAPVWVALDTAPHWRWLVDRRDSPWYPTMRLFRREASSDWGHVFQHMATELAELASCRSGGAARRMERS